MDLSISNSNQRLPTKHWGSIWLAVSISLLLIIITPDIYLRSQGWKPSIADTKDLWANQRIRANEIGDNAMIFVGASRMQLGIDMPTVRELTNYEPIQLAINSSIFFPVLENLANDPNVTGKIIISATSWTIQSYQQIGKANEWVEHYSHYYAQDKMEPYRYINILAHDLITRNLVSKRENGKPLKVISTLLNTSGERDYLIIYPDRSRKGDYSKAPMAYHKRLRKLFRHEISKNIGNELLIEQCQEAIDKSIKPRNSSGFLQAIDKIISYVKKIEARGGEVFFIRFPTDKLIWERANKLYPKDLFWDKLAELHPNTIHFKDYGNLRKFNQPDGSHLDYRDTAAFTRELLHIIKQKEYARNLSSTLINNKNRIDLSLNN